MELLVLPEDSPSLILDIGCGSGLSGQALSEEGHYWIGLDISEPMLKVAQEREVEGDLFLWDMGEGLGFRPGTFDGALSISALQWLCNADCTEHNPVRRLYSFFVSLYSCLARGARAVFQFYPENPDQMELITHQAMKAGFTGGVLIDYPNSSKAKKLYLCLFTGGAPVALPKALGTEDLKGEQNQVSFVEARKQLKRRGKDKVSVKSRDWIIAKKERRQRQGKEVRPDSKYTGRKRKPKF